MNPVIRVFFKIFLPLLLISLGALGFAYLTNTKPKVAEVEPPERAWPIAVIAAKKADYQPMLELYGTTVSARDVALRSLVGGEVIEVGADFKDGAVLREGALLIRIDPFDFIAGLDEKKAALSEGLARLAELQAILEADRIALTRDREILALDVRSLERSDALSKKGNISVRSHDDARMALSRQSQAVELREAQLKIQAAKIGQQKAAITRLRVGTRRAERDLENTRLTAPFDGYLTEIGAQLGKKIDAKDKVAHLIDASRIDVRFHLSNYQFGMLSASGEDIMGRRVSLRWRTGETIRKFSATVARQGSNIDSDTGGIDLFARIDALPAGSALRPGAFVDISLPGAQYPNVIRIPETGLHQNNIVYLEKDGRLEPVSVAVVVVNGGYVYVKGSIEDGRNIVTTKFNEMGPGIKVEIR